MSRLFQFRYEVFSQTGVKGGGGALLRGDRRSCIGRFADALDKRNFSQQRYVFTAGQLLCSSFTEDVVPVCRQFCRCEPGHVFHNAQYGNIDLLGPEHPDAAPDVGQCDLLRRADDDRPGNFQVLHQREVDIARAGRHVDQQEIQFSPIGLVEGCANETNGKLLYDFILSKEGQEILVENNLLSVRDDVDQKGASVEDIAKAAMTVDLQSLSDNSDQIIDTFDKIFK